MHEVFGGVLASKWRRASILFSKAAARGRLSHDWTSTRLYGPRPRRSSSGKPGTGPSLCSSWDKVRWASEPVGKRFSPFDGFGEPSYNLFTCNKSRALKPNSVYLTPHVTRVGNSTYRALLCSAAALVIRSSSGGADGREAVESNTGWDLARRQPCRLRHQGQSRG